MVEDDAASGYLDGLVGEFVVECRESLDQLDLDLLALERAPSSTELLSGAFRTLHTIKGSSGFLGFDRLEAVTHAGENLLGALRDGDLTLTHELVTLLLEVGDATRSLVDEIERSGGEGDLDPAALVARVAAARDTTPHQPARTAGDDKPGEPDAASQTPLLGDLLLARGVVTSDTLGRALAAQKAGDSRPLGVILVDLGVPEEQVDATVRQQHEMRASLVDGTVRVDVALLDSLMTLGAGLVHLVRELRGSVRREAPQLADAVQAVERGVAEVNAGVVKARLQPVHAVWSRLPRMVRDLSVQVGKSVELSTHGGDTEIDRTVLEAVRDPLTHLVRNSIDHGIEPPDVRVACGKPATGRLEVRAYHDRAEVVIEIRDDGAGIDPDRIRTKAARSGLRTREEVALLDDDEVVDLVFEPGLSTVDTVTSISGRGVGMDVVRTSVERLGGRVELLTRRGQGTTIRLRTPLTVAVVSARLVTVSGQRYALPSSVADGVGSSRVDLRVALGLSDTAPGTAVLLAVGGGLVDVLVDEAGEREDLVVKPLDEESASPLLIGSATCGDGTVALVLDPVVLAAAVPGGPADPPAGTTPGRLPPAPTASSDVERLRRAVADVWSAYGLGGADLSPPWSSDAVAQLAQRSAVVRARIGLGPATQVVLELSRTAAYRVTGRMLDTDRVTEEQIADALGEVVNMLGGTMKEAVSERGRLGLPVVEWLTGADVVPTESRAEAGFAMAGEPVCVRLGDAPTSDKSRHHDRTNGEEAMRILIVDDSRVMRQIVVRTLRQAGYTGHELVEAGNGQEALHEVRNQAPDLILSDWNMPVMDGLDLLQTLRATGSTIPFGFVTSEVSSSMAALAAESGADFVITKPFTLETFRESLDPVLS